MKPPPFEYRRPGTVAEAVALLGPGVRALAGGQSLMPLLNLRRIRPAVLVDITRVPGLDQVEVTTDAVRIGATARMRVIERDPRVRAALPVLAEALALVGHPQIRNQGTIGGSLCHADPAAELPVVAVALDARLSLASTRGRRVEAAGDFFRAGATTSREPDELLTAVELPRHAGFRFCFEEVPARRRDFAFVAVCVGVALQGDVVAAARLAAGGVADRPSRLTAAEAALTGRRLTDDLGDVLDLAAAAVTEAPGVRGPRGFRAALLRTALQRAADRLAAPGVAVPVPPAGTGSAR